MKTCLNLAQNVSSIEGSVHLVWSLTYIILMEVTVEHRRGLTGGVAQIGWNIGAMLMTFSAFALRSWHWMQLANAVFSLLLVLYYFLVPGWIMVVQGDPSALVLYLIAINLGRFPVLLWQ